MKKKFYPFLLLGVLFAFVSCKSKKNMIASSSASTLTIDTVTPLKKDTHVPSKHSEVNDLGEEIEKERKAKIFSDETVPGIKISYSALDLGTDYSGIERVMYYDFINDDIPEAFDGFRIAFI